ncbi:MAG: tetratricopeptide repeat protein [bacterium]
MSIIFVGVIIFSAIIVIKYSEPVSNFFKQIARDGTYKAIKSSKNIQISKKNKEMLRIGQMVELRDMLENQQFKKLNNILEEYQNNFEKDQTEEYKIYDAFHAFSITDSSYEESFETWINDFPDNYQPYLALAHYYYAKGWESRGYKFIDETSKEQLDRMLFYFLKSEENLRIALKMNPHLLSGYELLIGIYNATGNDAAEDAVIEKALTLFPYSFLIRSCMIWAKQPRWGGSYSAMEKIAKEAERYADINPELTLLYGFIYIDQGRILERRKKYEEALKFYTKALTFGDHWSFYCERAKIYLFDLHEYDRALENINRCIELRPTKDEIYLLRSRIYFAKGSYRDSLDELETTELIKPDDPSTKKWKLWASKNLLNRGHRLFKTDLHAAIEKYDLSISFDNDNSESYYWRGLASYKIKDFESALSDFNRAIEINPYHFESYRMADYILAKDKQWDTIREYWNRFIELEPDHAEAYLERAGTNYHNKDFASALDDFEKSCDLGNEEACKRYNQLKTRL